MPDKSKSGTSVKGGRDVNLGGDAVGGDKVTTNVHSTTTVNAGAAPNYVLFGLIGIAALAIIVLTVIALNDHNPPSPSPSAPPITFTPLPSGTPGPPSATPSPTATLPPTATEQPSATPIPGVPPTPTSAIAAFDFFSDNCLENNRWILRAQQNAAYATAIPSRGNCLDARRQFFAQDDGKLSVFLDQDATRTSEQEHVFVPLTGEKCYKQVEVVAAVDDVQTLTDTRRAYLSMGVELSRVAGDGYLEVRLEGTNTAGSFLTQAIARLILDDGGYVNFPALPYALHQVVTVAFRIKGNRLTAYLDDKPIAGPFPIISELCVVGLGYHADIETLLDAYYDEIRLQYAE